MKTSFVVLLSAVATVMALDSAPKQPLPRELFSPATEEEKRVWAGPARRLLLPLQPLQQARLPYLPLLKRMKQSSRVK
ncbi:hypothetical protein ACCO45_012368 [Purpureocillium lilacinum]|uniref:Uncharacterized protein n=1 Tax=Purpureocillium lilacinum TaxID=33203 RepID=A0ACC4D7U0_PURLI